MKRARGDQGFECVEPELGRLVWRQMDELTPRLREHVRVCDACRLRLAVGREVAAGLASGSLRLPGEARPSRARGPATLLAWSGVTAAAAALALLLALPPLPVRAGAVQRAGQEAAFRRPVEGEVLADLTPRLTWREIPGASRYELSLRQVDGRYVWRTSTTAPAAEVPDAMALPRGADLRATVDPVPRDLAAPGELTVGFRTGSWGEALLHRLWASRPWTRAAGLLALLLLGASLVAGRLARRWEGVGA